jgi:hypothetical protein
VAGGVAGACWGCFLVGRVARCGGVGGLVVLVSVCAGVGAVFESVVAAQRALGRGKAGGGPGEPGNRAVGGFRVPPVLAASASRRCGAVCAAARAVSSVICAAGSVVVCRGGRNGGLGENLEPGDLGCSGGSGFPPSAFPDWSPLLPVYSCSRAVPDLGLLLFEGVRSGTRRRRGGSAPAQAGGGTETETPRTAPAHAGAVLYGGCAGAVWDFASAGQG